ncbi:MAG: ABC transporter ATP-binding protein [Pseudomonadota bacterium]
MTQKIPRGRAGVISLVLAFTFRHWARQKPRVVAIMLAVAVGTLADVFLPLYAGSLADALTHGPAGRHDALTAFGIMTLLGLLPLFTRQIAMAEIITFTLRIMQDATRDAFHRVQRFSTDWHANSFAGSVVRKITRGMWAVDQLNDVLLFSLLPAFVVLIGTMILLSLHSPMLGLTMAIGSSAYVIVAIGLSTRIVAPAASLSNRWDTRMGGMLADAIGANSVVKAFGAETREDLRIRLIAAKWARRTRRTWAFATWSGTAQLLLLWGVRAAVSGVGLRLWWLGLASPGDIVYVLTTYFVIHGYLRDVGQHVQHLQRSVNDMEELVEIHGEALGIEDHPEATPFRVSAGEIRFEHVCFHYEGHDRPLYEDLNIVIPAGQRVGLVGRSGSGKTTFVKLIQRFYDVRRGYVRIDGHDVARATQDSLRRQIAIVAQEPILFHRSLAENIAYSRPDATQDEIEQAARLANAHEFIAALPRQYRTLVGERGVKLSGGERQRVALARAFLADAPILILDEATSSLDSESEVLIQDAIERLMAGRTAIIIAHRLSTVRALDRILVFDQGRIVEDGTHSELLAKNDGHYRRLFDHQSGGIRTAEPTW